MKSKKKKKIVIFGNGNHCKIVKQEILENQDFEIYAIYDFKGGKRKTRSAGRGAQPRRHETITGVCALPCCIAVPNRP